MKKKKLFVVLGVMCGAACVAGLVRKKKNNKKRVAEANDSANYENSNVKTLEDEMLADTRPLCRMMR